GAGGDLCGHRGVGQLLPVVAVHGGGVDALLPAQVVGQNAGARALLPVDVPQVGNVPKALDTQRIALGHHQALGAAHALHLIYPSVGEILLQIGGVVAAVGLVQQVTPRPVGLPPAEGHNAPHGAHMGGAHVQV